MNYEYLGFDASTEAATDDHMLDLVKVEGYTAVVGGELEFEPNILLSLGNNVKDIIAITLALVVTLYLVFIMKSKT